MRKAIAIFVAKDVVWETPLGPFVPPDYTDEQIIAAVKEMSWNQINPGDEPENWREFRMEVRLYNND